MKYHMAGHPLQRLLNSNSEMRMNHNAQVQETMIIVMYSCTLNVYQYSNKYTIF